ncbi:MAG: DUF6712 family protein [Bacteroidota bacterium]
MILNRSGAGATELKELIGFIYKSITFSNLKSYVSFAERDIKKVIGPEVFKAAEDHYMSAFYHLATPDEDHPEYLLLEELIEKIQLPVAIHAYRRYVPSSDLTHSDKGRQIFVSEQEKPAFEWQIEKDNENLISLEHEAIDVLLEFLDEHIDEKDLDLNVIIPWGTSAAYKATKELLIPTVKEFENVFLIGGSRMTFLSLVPMIKRIQENDIKACLGETKYTQITEQVLDNDLTPENIIILDKIRPPLALMALSVAVKRLSSEVLPAGIFTNITANVVKGKTPASKQERNEIASSLEKDGMRELVKLQEYIRKLDTAAAGEIFTPNDPTDIIDPLLKFVRL